MQVLGPVIDRQEQPRRAQALDQAIEYGLRLGVHPVQVFEDQQERLDPALVEQEAFHRVLDPPALLGRIEIAPGRVVDGNVEQREERRER